MMNASAYKVLSPTAILGYGFPESSFKSGMERKPDLVAVDAGSTDPGPFYLGAGKSFTDREAVKRDIGIILPAVVKAGIPFVIGTAGGCGAKKHVDWQLDIIREVSAEQNLSFRMGVIYADIEKEIVLRALQAGKIESLENVPELDEKTIEASLGIVAQMGEDPVVQALDQGCTVVVTGRCYDPVAFGAPAVRAGFDPGLAYHMGKILECAAIAADPADGRDCALGILEKERFILEAPNPKRQFSRMSAAAHTLYEKSDPYSLPGPDGTIDLRETVFEELGDGRVAISGSKFVKPDQKRIKLEAARKIGYRTISIAGARDPLFIKQSDVIIKAIRETVGKQVAEDHHLIVRQYGKDGVMGELEPIRNATPHELGLVIEAVAGHQETANTVCSLARSMMLHYGYEGRIATGGNLAFPYSPSDISCGPVYEFSMYHLMEIDDAPTLFPVIVEEVGS